MHAIFNADKFDLQFTVQDCAVNELLFTLYEAGVKLPLALPILTTNKLGLLVGGDLTTQFGKDQPCKILVYPTELPKIEKQFTSFETWSQDNYWMLDTNLAMDIMCIKTNQTEFE